MVEVSDADVECLPFGGRPWEQPGEIKDRIWSRQCLRFSLRKWKMLIGMMPGPRISIPGRVDEWMAAWKERGWLLLGVSW